MNSIVKMKVLILCVLFAFLLYIVSPNNQFRSLVAAANEGNNSSFIGGIEIGNLVGEDLELFLVEKVKDWQNGVLEVEGGGSTIHLNRGLLAFNVKETVKTYERLIDRPWYAFWQEEKIVHIPFIIDNASYINEAIKHMELWDIEQTSANITLAAGMLKTDTVQAIVKTNALVDQERIAATIQPIPPEASGVTLLAEYLNETTVNTGETFSMLEKSHDLLNGVNDQALSFMAALIFKNALHTNTEIVERHSHKEIPSFVEPGYDAYISKQMKENLQFKNVSTQAMVLKFSVDGQNLKAEVFSVTKEDNVNVLLKQREEVNPREVIRYSPDLPIGEIQVLQEPQKGLRILLSRSINGKEQELIRSYYAPINRIVVKSARYLENVGNTNDSPFSNPSSSLDLDGDGLPDIEQNESILGDMMDEEVHYDKGGNVID